MPLLWNPDASIPVSLSSSTTTASKTSSSRSPVDAAPNPRKEAARMAALKRLRHKFVILCSSSSSSSSANHHNVKPPVLAFERWLSRYALRRDLVLNDDHGSSSASVLDPIVPSDGICDEGLVKDLSRILPWDASNSIAESMAKDGKAAGQRIQEQGNRNSTESGGGAANAESASTNKKQIKEKTKEVKKASKLVQKCLLNEKGSNDLNLESSLSKLQKATTELTDCTQKIQRDAGHIAQISIDSSRRFGIYDVALIGPEGNPKKPYLTITSDHLQKIYDLWTYNSTDEEVHHINDNRKSSSGNKHQKKDQIMTKINSLSDKDRIQFLNLLYCCLARYEGLKGAGYQCAVPPIAFKAAATQLGLGTTIECFASPFNCHYRHYCSAFSDLESPRLGSLGSFFSSKFQPIEGSFEVNPPFVPEIMNEMSTKLHQLLENPNAKCLSFLIVVPAWGSVGIQFCHDLESSTCCRAKSRILASDHVYCDGSQHNLLVVNKKRSTSMANEKQRGRQDEEGLGGQGPPVRPSSWDTAVILLQNDLGAKEWPVTNDELETSFCKAMKRASSQLEEDSSTIEKWEKRGIGRGGRAGNSSHKQHNKRIRYE